MPERGVTEEAARRLKYALRDDPAIGSELLARDIETLPSAYEAAEQRAEAAEARTGDLRKLNAKALAAHSQAEAALQSAELDVKWQREQLARVKEKEAA